MFNVIEFKISIYCLSTSLTKLCHLIKVKKNTTEKKYDLDFLM